MRSDLVVDALAGLVRDLAYAGGGAALADDLQVVSVTQLLALNLPNTDALRSDVEELDATLSFGHLRRSDLTGVTTDVLQYYTFPVGELGDVPLLTVLHIVLSGGDDIARKLVDAS